MKRVFTVTIDGKWAAVPPKHESHYIIPAVGLFRQFVQDGWIYWIAASDGHQACSAVVDVHWEDDAPELEFPLAIPIEALPTAGAGDRIGCMVDDDGEIIGWQSKKGIQQPSTYAEQLKLLIPIAGIIPREREDTEFVEILIDADVLMKAASAMCVNGDHKIRMRIRTGAKDDNKSHAIGLYGSPGTIGAMMPCNNNGGLSGENWNRRLDDLTAALKA